jgi:hypothetical protein
MRASSLLNLTLAVLTALWTPAWCCCARLAEDRAASLASAEAPCPRCHEERTRQDEAPAPAPSCPHASVRAFATLDKAPTLELPSLTIIALLDPAPAPLMPRAAAHALPAAGGLPPPIAASLLDLACLHLI